MLALDLSVVAVLTRMMYCADATELVVYPFAAAIALTVSLAEIVRGTENLLEPTVGVEPSVV